MHAQTNSDGSDYCGDHTIPRGACADNEKIKIRLSRSDIN